MMRSILPQKKKLICLLPLTVLGSFHWGFLWGDPAREMLIYNRMQSGGGGGPNQKKQKTNQFSPDKTGDWIVL